MIAMIGKNEHILVNRNFNSFSFLRKNNNEGRLPWVLFPSNSE